MWLRSPPSFLRSRAALGAAWSFVPKADHSTGFGTTGPYPLVRQLRNALERAAILCEGGLITAEHLALKEERSGQAPLVIAQPTTDLNTLERDMIKQALAECIGNKSKAAARLGISRTQLYVRMRKYQLS